MKSHHQDFRVHIMVLEPVTIRSGAYSPCRFEAYTLRWSNVKMQTFWRILNNVSFIRSVVGRVSIPFGVTSGSLLAVPAITLICLPPCSMFVFLNFVVLYTLTTLL